MVVLVEANQSQQLFITVLAFLHNKKLILIFRLENIANNTTGYLPTAYGGNCY